MKIQELIQEKWSGNASVPGVLDTLRNIYVGIRTNTSAKLCHAHTARNIDPNHPDDTIVLFGFGDTVVHSALVRSGKIVDRYEGVTSSTLLPSGNLQINVRDNIDELEPVFSIRVGEFLETLNGRT